MGPFVFLRTRSCMIQKISIIIIFFLTIIVNTINHAEIKPLYAFKASDTTIRILAMSPHEDFIVTGTSNNFGNKKFAGFTIWDKKDQHSLELDRKKFQAHMIPPLDSSNIKPATSLAVLSDNHTILGADTDYIFKYDKDNKKYIKFERYYSQKHDKTNFIWPSAQIINFQILPNEKSLIVALRGGESENPFAIKYNLASGKSEQLLKGLEFQQSAIILSQDKKLLGSIITLKHNVKIWDAASFNEITTIAEKNKDPYSLYISNNYVAIGFEGSIALYDRKKFSSVWHFDFKFDPKTEHALPIKMLTVTPDEQFIIFYNSYQKMGIINIKTKEKYDLEFFDNTLKPSIFTLNETGKFLLVGFDNGIVHVYSFNDLISAKKDITNYHNNLKDLSQTLICLSSSFHAKSST